MGHKTKATGPKTQVFTRYVALCAGVSAMLGTPSISYAANEACKKLKDHPATTEGWFLSAGSCLGTFLENKATSAIGDIAMDLIGTAMNAYIPGLGSFLSFIGGGGEDPFAQHARMILNRIETAETRVIQTIQLTAVENDKVELDTLVENWNFYWNDPLDDRYQQRIDPLNTLKLGFTRVRRSMELGRHGVPSLHSYFMAQRRLMQVQAEQNYLLAVGSILGVNRDLRELTNRENETAVRNGTTNTLADLSVSLNADNGVFAYLEDLGNGGFREYSDQRFSTPTLDRFGNTCSAAFTTPVMQWMSYKFPLQNGNSAMTVAEREAANAQASVYNLRWERDAGACGAKVGGLAKLVLDGVVIDQERSTPTDSTVPTSVRQQAVADAMNRMIARHKTDAYRALVLDAYGALRPEADKWWRLVNGDTFAPDSEADMVLEDIVFLGATSDISALLLAGRGWGPLNPTDIRRITNYGLTHTLGSFRTIVNAAPQDSMGGPTAGDIRRLLADLVPPGEAAARFRNNKIAKILAVTTML